jgi:hypothetical protein
MIRSTLITTRPTLGGCFEALLSARFLPRRWSGRIWSPEGLPSPLQRCVRNLKPDWEWRAYGDEEELLFSVARFRNHKIAASMPALEVLFFDSDAAVYCAGIWEFDEVHGWWLDSLLDLSYDCQRGWWLDSVVDVPTAPRSVAGIETAMGPRGCAGSPRRDAGLPSKVRS